jgi:OmpA-OmpF porin, OOP family
MLMKNQLRPLTIIGAAFTLAAFMAPAAYSQVYGDPYAQQNRWYIKADAGGNITRDTDLESFFGEDTTGSKVRFDPGVRFGIGAGYQVTDWFAAEAETGVMANWIDSIDGANDVEASFSSVPLLVNIKFQCPRLHRIAPYIGAGVGVSFQVIDSDEIDFGSTFMHGSDTDAVFAYQGFAGVRFKLNDNMGLSVEYRYFAAEEAEWDAEFSSGTGSDEMGFGRIETHAFSVAFDFSF